MKKVVKRKPVKSKKKIINWKEIVVFLAVGYILMSATQSLFCGTKPVSVCEIGLIAIPVWIILGIFYFIKLKK